MRHLPIAIMTMV